MKQNKIAGILILVLVLIGASLFHFLWKGGADVAKIRLALYLQYAFVGSALALGGMILQNLMHNPLAEPYVLGVSGGASFGAVLAVFFTLTPLFMFRALLALVFSGGVTLLLWLFSRTRNGFSVTRALLAGVGFNAFATALIMLLQNLLSPNDFKTSVGWLMGQIDFITPAESVLVGVAALVPVLFVLRYGREMEIYSAGEEMARAVGVDTTRLKILGFITVSLSAALAVSVVGMIGFVGLVSPHIARLAFGGRGRKVLVPNILVGVTLLVVAGNLSKHLVPGAYLPVGVLTSLIGAPFFIVLLATRLKAE